MKNFARLGNFMFGNKDIKKIKGGRCGVKDCKQEGIYIHKQGLLSFYITCKQHKELIVDGK